MSTLVPPLFAGLVDDGSVLPPTFAGVPAAVARHREHEHAWYADLLGNLLLPSSSVDFEAPVDGLATTVISDGPLSALPVAVRKLQEAGAEVRLVEAAVARRGEDPQPGLAELRRLAEDGVDVQVYAEIPLSWGLLAALDAVAEMRAQGVRVAPKFRVGGLAAELFPTPVELAAVICACRDRELPFKLAAGVQQALRHTDPETGFTHHGFLNVLVGTLAAVAGAEVAEVAEALAATHPVPLVEPARQHRDDQRPLWAGFAANDVMVVVTDLVRLGLVNGGGRA